VPEPGAAAHAVGAEQVGIGARAIDQLDRLALQRRLDDIGRSGGEA